MGRFKIDYASLDDSNPKTGEADPGIIASNARVATQDTSTIAYIGELDSAATAVSLSFVNGAGILQVSPASPYVGLTSSLDAGQDEPERFYPSGQRTFARLMPGDEVQAAAQVRLMRVLHLPSVYVIDDLDPFNAPLASIFAEDAKRAGIAVLGEDQIETTAGTEFSGEVHKVLESGARAVFFSGNPNAGAVALWQQLYAADAPPAPAGAEQPRRTLVRRADRLGGGAHLPHHAAAGAPALPVARAAGARRIPRSLSPYRRALRAVRV